ncbi:MAG: 2-oxoglutarate dehydrogenase complex dihydrolipoyllysine-residue succinyltransferase [Leptospiraceae bacterium]|nr:2-oxoglutarate dehydrogenase complex dihydrolipoyllysine-residue succinyltransferase [Leptospiraceae bacterium]
MPNTHEIKIPPMGESITEGTIGRWFKKVGEAVAADEPVFEVETDKVTQEIYAPAAGVIQKIIKDEGSAVAIGEIAGVIEEGAAAAEPAKAEPSTPAKTESEPVKAAKSSEPAESKKQPAAETLPPAAKKMVAENNLNPNDISGTGKHGQVTKADVIDHLDKKPSAPISSPKTSVQSGDRENIVPMTRLRRAIADRLVSAQQTAAILTTFNEVDMHELMNLRKTYNEEYQKKYGIKLGFMSFFTKAVVAALKEIPAINAEIRNSDIVYKNFYDIGVAVGGPKGLVVPVVRNADQMSFAEIEQEIGRLAQKVQNGQVTLGDLEGGTFTISNGGIYGSMMSTPILNPPQSGILGMHNIVKRPVVINDQIVIRPMMYIALSYDHRIVDGKEAVTFLIKVKNAIEDPLRLMLEV